MITVKIYKHSYLTLEVASHQLETFKHEDDDTKFKQMSHSVL